MMSSHQVSNGHVHSNHKNNGVDKQQCNGLVIPIQKIGHHWSNESDDSFDSLHGENAITAEPVPATAFSKPFGGSHTASSFNVYSLSPRTSVLYDYYRQPKGFFENQSPLTHASKSTGHYCTSNHTKDNHREASRTISDCCENTGKPPSPMISGIPCSVYNEAFEDPRRRAWSESAKDPRKSTMHMHRTSALKRIRMKLQKSGHKKKEEHNHHDSPNQSNGSTNSLEKTGIRYSMKNASPSSSKRNTMTELDIDEMGMLSLHPDDAFRRTSSEMSPDRRKSPVFTDQPRLLSTPSLQDTDLIYQRFLEEHTCYDIMPTSCKLVVFDTHLSASKAFNALIANAVRSAPLWDPDISCYVGMLTVTDFIKVILIAHRAENMQVSSIENETIDSWRKLLNQQSSFASVHPEDSLLHSLKFLINEHFHGVPIMDEDTGDIFHIVNHKRILRFLHLFIKELPIPSFMQKKLSEIKIGTYKDVATVTRDDTMLHVLEILVNKSLSAIPVVDKEGEVEDVFCKLDMISLAAQGLYHDLSTTLDVALACRFKPLFEDEECQADAFTRFSSPKPQRRDVNIRRKFPPGSDITPPNERPGQFTSRYGNGTPRGQQVTRAGFDKSPLTRRYQTTGDVTQPQHGPTHRQLSVPVEPSVMHECAGHKVRHKSLSNPLVKCRLNDTLQYIIDLMVGTEANLLVVVGPNSSHVIGVITVADVLHFIVNPQGNTLDTHSPSRFQRRSRHQFTSTSSTSSQGSSLSRTRSSCYEESLSASPNLNSSNLSYL